MILKNKIVLVTGGAGFIGSHLVDRCLAEGAEKVISFDNLIGGKAVDHAHLSQEPRFVFVNGDIQDYESIQPYVEQSDVIFNEAASKLVVSLNNPLIDVQTNVLGNFNILEIIRKSKNNPRIIHASTGSVFGSSERPFKEEDPKNPSTIYGISKLAAENYFQFYHKNYGIQSTILRYFHVFGPRQDYSGEAGVINIFLSRVLRGLNPQVCGPGTQVRCFTYVADDVQANFLAYLNNSTVGQDYNVASKTRISILGLAKLIIEKYGDKNLYPEMHPEMTAPRMGENLKPIPDTSKIEALGFRESLSFEEGLEITKQWIFQDMKQQGEIK